MPTLSASFCWEHSYHNFDKQAIPVYTLAIFKVLWMNVIRIFTSSPETLKNLQKNFYIWPLLAFPTPILTYEFYSPH